MNSEAQRTGSPEQRRETVWQRFVANVKTIGGALLLAMVIRICLVEFFEIEGPSMEPTLQNGDRVMVVKFFYGVFLPLTRSAIVNWGTPNRGDVVIIKSPADEQDIVKRVIGVPGDTIEIIDDVIFRNGKPLIHQAIGPCTEQSMPDIFGGCEWVREGTSERTYRISHSVSTAPSNHPALKVPPDYLFILGDHRDRSNDSRFFGVVPVTRVKGRALAIYWSSGDSVRWNRLFSLVN